MTPVPSVSPPLRSEKILANTKAWLGALLIGAAFMLITRDTLFPGAWASLPTLGAALVIWAGPHAFVNKAVLSRPTLVWVGIISYPLYLWHWVLLTFDRIAIVGIPTAERRWIALALAALLAWLTYLLVEKPLRFGEAHRRKSLALVAVMVAVATLGFACYKTKDSSSWFFAGQGDAAKEVDELAAIHQTNLTRWQNPKETVKCFQLPPPYDTPTADFFQRNGCLSSSPGKASVLLMGDSHSASLSLGLRNWANAAGVNFLQTSGFAGPALYCVDAPGDEREGCETAHIREVMKTIIATKPDVLVFNLYWSQSGTVRRFTDLKRYKERVLSSITKLANSLGVKKVVVVGQMPTWYPNLPHSLIRNFISKHQKIPERTWTGVVKESLEMDTFMRSWNQPPGYYYFSVKDILCKDDGCLTRVGNDLATDIVVWDYGHLTQAGSDYVAAHGAMVESW